MRSPLQFRNHFLWLAGAVVLIAVSDLANWFRAPFLPSFAIYAALHGLTVVLALTGPRRGLARKLLFIGAAAALNVAVLYAGIISLQALGEIPAGLRLYLSLSVCALFGAIAYGFLLRFFWWPQLRPRAVAHTAFGCTAAALLGLGIQQLTQPFGNWWLVALWWLAFSAGLWRADRRAHPLGAQPHPQ